MARREMKREAWRAQAWHGETCKLETGTVTKFEACRAILSWHASPHTIGYHFVLQHRPAGAARFRDVPFAR